MTIFVVKSRSAFDADISVMYDIYLDLVESCIKLSLKIQETIARSGMEALSSVLGPQNKGQETIAEPLPGISLTWNSWKQ